MIFNSLGGSTDFANGANPSNLPGGETVTPPFEATQIFSADAQGNPSKGVDSSIDIVGLAFELLAGKDIDDVIAALDSGELRIGLHVRAIGPDSDSFVNGSQIPEPTTAALAVAATLCLAVRRRR